MNLVFTGVKLKNFKSLVDFEVQFPKNRKLILIYGENGVGKSNFVEAFNVLKKLATCKPVDSESEEDTELFRTPNLKKIIESCKTLNSEGKNMLLSFEFNLEGKRGSYSIETDDTKVVSEKLEYVYNKKVVEFFSINNGKLFLNKKIIKNGDYYNELVSSYEKYWGKSTLMALLSKDRTTKNDKYMTKSLTKNMIEIVDYIGGVDVSINAQTSYSGMNLGRGVVSITEQDKINRNEKILDDIFTNLFVDVKKAYYQRETVDDGKIKYKLYFEKIIKNEILNVSISRESMGTKQVLNLMQYILYNLDNPVLIIDEFDTGMHDILAKSILQSLKDSLESQIIITTHNTLLIESKNLCKNAYVLTHNIDGTKEMIAISDFEKRLHNNLNIRDRYLRGMYGGIPIPLDIDFSDYKGSEQEDS